MLKFKRYMSAILAVVMCLGMTACGSSPAPETSETPSGTSQSAASEQPTDNNSGGGACTIDLFSVGSADQFGAFLWGSSMGDAYIAGYMVYDFLFWYDRDAKETTSDVLSDWSYEDDTTFVMTLKDGITFSDGTPMTAEDVLFSMQTYVLQEENNYINKFTMIDFDNSYTDGNQIVVKFLQEYGPGILSVEIPIYCKSWVEERGYDSSDWRYAPMGSGPFVVEEYVDDTYCLLSKNPNYWGDSSMYPEQIKVVHYNETSTMYVDLETGTLDMACNIANSDYNRTKDETDSDISVEVVSTGDNMFFCMEGDTNEYLSDENVRKAICLGTDWDAVAQAGYGDMYTEEDSMINSASSYYESIGTYEYDPDTAKQLLTDAGYSDGQINLVCNSFAVDMQEDMMETIQYYLLELGINVELNFMEPAGVVPLLVQPNGTDVVLNCSASGAPSGEPHDYLGGYMDGYGYFPINIIEDETFNKYMQAALNSVDYETRKENYTAAAQYNFDHYLMVSICGIAKPIAYDNTKIVDTNLLSASYPNLRFCTFATN